MKNGLTGKSIIVTGGASGIGKGAVKLLLEAGCKVTVADIAPIDIDAMAAQPGVSEQAEIQSVRTDISDETQVKAMVDQAVTRFGRLDAGINCAGYAPAGLLLHEVSTEDWDRSHGINLRGTFFCVKYQIIAMLNNGGGSIVVFSSLSARCGAPGVSEYAAAKSGLHGLVYAAAHDYAAQGIRLNAVMPGATRTPMLEAALEKLENLDAIVASLPMRRLGEPEEVAAGAVWLASDHASYVTGVVMQIDGGLMVV